MKIIKMKTLCGAVMAGVAPLLAANIASAATLDEIVVTAQKRSESAQDVGMSINALSADAIKEAGIANASDLGKVVPGFVYTKTPRGTPTYALRGIGFDDNSLASAPTVSIYLDEAPMAYPVMTRHIAFDLAQVEVLKGPQGILFGQNSTGGAVNFIAEKPTDEFEAGVEASYGSFDTFETKGYVSGTIADNFRVRLSGMSIQSDEGWQESYTRSDKLGEQDVFAARLLADWEPTEDLSVKFALQGWCDKSDTQAGQLIETHHSIDVGANPVYDAYPRSGNDAQDADWDSNPANPLERDDQFVQSSIRFDYNLSDTITLTSITSYSDYEQDFYQDTDGADLQNFTLRNDGSIESFSQELRLSGDTDSIKWVVGVNYSEDESKDDTTYFFSQNSVAAFGIAEALSTADQEVETKAIFGNVAWSIDDQFTLNVGVRHTEDDREYEGCTADTGDGTMAALFSGLWLGVAPNDPSAIQAGACTTGILQPGMDPLAFVPGTPGFYVPGLMKRELDERNTSWRIGLDWQVNDDFLAYANISKGYKSGSIPAVNSSTDAQVDPVTQESVLAYELGFKSTLMDGAMRLNGAVWYYDYENKQLRGRILDNVFGSLEALVNVPESTVKGVELGMDLLPIENLTISLNASYTETEVDKGPAPNDSYDPLGTQISYDGLSFPHTPELHISARAHYEVSISDSLIGFADISILHQDETTGLFADKAVLATTQISPATRPGVFADPDMFDVDSYTTVDARIGVKADDLTWEVALWGKNLTDEYYWNNATQGLDNVYRLASKPRTYGISFAYNF